MSEPGWELEFDNAADLKGKLWKHICTACAWLDEYDGPVLHENSLIDDMLNTACGCEFRVEDPDNLLTPLS